MARGRRLPGLGAGSRGPRARGRETAPEPGKAGPSRVPSAVGAAAIGCGGGGRTGCNHMITFSRPMDE